RGTRLGHFLAFESSFQGGVSVATGDVNGKRQAEIVAAAGPGRPAELRVFDAGGRQLRSLFPFGADYTGGLRVAAGDLNTDGHDEIVVTPGFGGDSRVHIYNGALDEIGGFQAYDWIGAGMNVALPTRFGLPITASPRTLKLRAGKRQSVVVAWFRDAAGSSRNDVRVTIDWG